MGVTIFRLKKDGHVYTEYISDGIARICGYDNGKVYLEDIADNTSKYVYPGDFQIIEDACKKNHINGGSSSIRYRIYNKKGKVIWLQLDFVEIKEATLTDDNLAEFYGVQTFVSDDVIQAEKEKEYYRTILNITKTTYFEVDDVGNFYASDSFSKYKASEYGVSGIRGNANSKKCFHPDDLPKLANYLHNINDESKDPAIVVRALMKDGSYQWTAITNYIEYTDDHKVKRMTGILQDVNPELEKQKIELEEALAEAQKANSAKTMFLSNMSHDMRTPMNAIIGLSNLAMDSQTIEELKEYMDKINTSGKQLLDLINDTLDVSRIENGKLTLNREYIMSSLFSQEVIASTKVIAEQKGIKFSVVADGLILMDIRMPNMDGIQTTKEIRKLNRDDAARIPIVAVSANAFDEDVKASLDAGMNEHLAKPIDPNTLYQILCKYLN